MVILAAGYPGIMVTDTAPFRYPYYHSADDTPDKLDYDRFALVVSGMEKVIEDLDKIVGSNFGPGVAAEINWIGRIIRSKSC